MGILSQNNKLDLSEATMKRLLLEWVGEFLDEPRLQSWIVSSWASVFKCLPVGDSVDLVPPPPWVTLITRGSAFLSITRVRHLLFTFISDIAKMSLVVYLQSLHQ